MEIYTVQAMEMWAGKQLWSSRRQQDVRSAMEKEKYLEATKS